MSSSQYECAQHDWDGKFFLPLVVGNQEMLRRVMTIHYQGYPSTAQVHVDYRLDRQYYQSYSSMALVHVDSTCWMDSRNTCHCPKAQLEVIIFCLVSSGEAHQYLNSLLKPQRG